MQTDLPAGRKAQEVTFAWSFKSNMLGVAPTFGILLNTARRKLMDLRKEIPNSSIGLLGPGKHVLTK